MTRDIKDLKPYQYRAKILRLGMLAETQNRQLRLQSDEILRLSRIARKLKRELTSQGSVITHQVVLLRKKEKQ